MPLLYDWLTSCVQDRGSARALVHRDTYLSWRGLAHRVDRRAQELKSYGITKGAWVGLMLGNVPEFAVLSLALSKLEAVAVPIDPTTSVRDLDMILEAAPLRALVTRPLSESTTPTGPAPTSSPTPGLRITGSTRAIASKFMPESRRRLQGTLLNLNLYRRDAPGVIDGVTPASVHLTADTGGDPKGVVRGEPHLAAIADLFGKTLELKAGKQLLAAAPLFLAFGYDAGLLTALAHGMTLVLEDEISPKNLVRTLRDETFDLVPGTPAFYGSLARVPLIRRAEPRDAHYLCSGAPLPRSVADGFEHRFGVRPKSCFHTTETGPVAIDLSGIAPETVGPPIPGVDVRITSAEGTKLSGGTKGQVWVRAGGISNVSVPKLPVPIRAVGRAGVTIGRADAEGWFRTGDLGLLDAEGRLQLDGREDDLVKIDGKRVALGEVAGCLESFAKVRAAEARVVYDDVHGPMVVARVVKDGSCRAEDLIDHCARNLAPYKVPRAIEFCSEL